MKYSFAYGLLVISLILQGCDKLGNSETNTMPAELGDALVTQATAIENVAKVLGIQELNPDTADHSF